MTLTSRVTLCFWLRKVNLHSLKKVCFPPLPTTQIKERGRERKGSPPDIDKGGGEEGVVMCGRQQKHKHKIH